MWQFNRLALWRAGARAVRITAERPFPIARLAAVVVGGGDDIQPTLYGASLEPAARVDPERDALELRVLDWTDRLRLPVLGICRGAQMINVHRGGSLHGDIHEVYPGARRLRTPLPRKAVEIERGSRLQAILGVERCCVNALHHQSVARLGGGLRTVARDEAGVVQAVEAVDGPAWLIGVQWHPEFLVLDRSQQGLFRALVRAAANGGAAVGPASAAAPADLGAGR
jgi:putative glutamine amidotransferase